MKKKRQEKVVRKTLGMGLGKNANKNSALRADVGATYFESC